MQVVGRDPHWLADALLLPDGQCSGGWPLPPCCHVGWQPVAHHDLCSDSCFACYCACQCGLPCHSLLALGHVCLQPHVPSAPTQTPLVVSLQNGSHHHQKDVGSNHLHHVVPTLLSWYLTSIICIDWLVIKVDAPVLLCGSHKLPTINLPGKTAACGMFLLVVPAKQLPPTVRLFPTSQVGSPVHKSAGHTAGVPAYPGVWSAEKCASQLLLHALRELWRHDA
jgi:hypothetical protein